MILFSRSRFLTTISFANYRENLRKSQVSKYQILCLNITNRHFAVPSEVMNHVILLNIWVVLVRNSFQTDSTLKIINAQWLKHSMKWAVKYSLQKIIPAFTKFYYSLFVQKLHKLPYFNASFIYIYIYIKKKSLVTPSFYFNFGAEVFGIVIPVKMAEHSFLVYRC